MPDPTAASSRLEDELGQRLARALVEGESVNDFLRRFTQAIADVLNVSAVVLYDYDETADTFDLLFFHGYESDARSTLHRQLVTLDVERACRQREPYPADTEGRRLLVPLYFRNVLEAVLLLERGTDPLPVDETTGPALQLISRFVGLFMSSNRLSVNQRKVVARVSDLERARDVQMSYLPSRYPATDRYEIFGYNQSSDLVGGDYFDFFSETDGAVQCVLADACGHGLAAALVMSHFRGLLQAEVRRGDDHASLFGRLNRLLYDGAGSLSYLTGVFLDYREREGQLRYLNAGHFDPVLVHASGDVSRLRGGGPPLGMFPGSEYEPGSAAVNPGDLLVLFTDGLVELMNPADECFGIDGACRAIIEHRHRPLSELATEVLASAAAFSQSRAEDDVTLFLMRFR